MHHGRVLAALASLWLASLSINCVPKKSARLSAISRGAHDTASPGDTRRENDTSASSENSRATRHVETDDEKDERQEETEIGGPHLQLDASSAQALSTLPVVTSLGDWRPLGPFDYSGKAFDVAVSPVDPNTVYGAFGKGGGLWKTANGGKTWLQLNDRSDLAATSCVTVHPRLPDVLVACVGSQYEVPTPRRGLLYSSNGGRHWDYIGPVDSLSSSFYRAIFDPRNADTIYAASEKGVYLTQDRGMHWTLILQFPGSNPDGYDQMPDLVMKPDDPATLIATQKNLGVVRSSDGGITWQKVDQAMDQSSAPSVLAWAPSDPTIVYCEHSTSDGLHEFTYASSDAGLTWKQAGYLQIRGLRYDMALAIDPTDASRAVIANADSGISPDGLRSYHSPRIAAHPDHLRVVFAPSDPSIVYSANDGGIWRSSDKGETWFRFDNGVNTNLSFGFDVNTASGKSYLSSGDYIFDFNDAARSASFSHIGSEWSKFFLDPNDPRSIWVTVQPPT